MHALATTTDDPVSEDELPVFTVEGDEIREAQLAAARFLAEAYLLQQVEGRLYRIVHRTDMGLESVYDKGEEEVRVFASRLASPAFRRIRFTPRINITPPLLVKSVFDKRWLGGFYLAYMKTHPVWRLLEYDPLRDVGGFETTEDDLPPPTVTTLAGAVTRAYRAWHKVRAVPDERMCTPAYYWQHSFTTGQESGGLIKVMKLFDKEIPHPNMGENIVMAAYFNVMRVLGAHGEWKTPPLKPPNLAGQDLTKSAGINLYQTGKLELDNTIFKFVLQAAKKDTEAAGRVEFQHVVELIRKHFRSEPQAGSHYVGTIMRKIVTAMFPKPELGDPWRDPEKARLIFIVPFLKFAIDKVLFGDVLNRTHGVPPVGIGWSKQRGGMQALYEHLVQYRIRDHLDGIHRDWFAADGDFSKLDFALAPNLLTLVGLLPFWFYHMAEKDEDYLVFRFLNEWSTDELVSKFLHLFPGEDRLVIGMMFSGSLLTSWGDTTYVWLAIEMWFIYVANQLRKYDPSNYDHWLSIWPLPQFIYGDDYLQYLPDYVYPYYVGKPWGDRAPGDKPIAFQKFLKEAANLTLKMEECGIYSKVESVPDGHGRLITKGPKFLQRYFVFAEAPLNVILRTAGCYNRGFMCYRVTTDYYTRASMLTTGRSIGQFVLKLRGLAEDTCGANWEAYQFLKAMHDGILEHPTYGPIALRDIEEIHDVVANTGTVFNELKIRIKGTGVSVWEMLLTFPSWSELQAKYWPTEAGVAQFKEKATSTGFYRFDFNVRDFIH